MKSNPINKDKYFLITVDVEDWFQVENFKSWIPFTSWNQRELRVEHSVHRLLDLFDSFESAQPPNFTASQPQTKCRPKATFFILGWIAERLPNLVHEIQSRGHEVASHGVNHQLCTEMSKKGLTRDLIDNKRLLEDITGVPILGYRAPSFAIDDDILKLVKDAGYLYDSSYNSFGLHGRYGKISLNGTGKRGIAHKLSDNFYELPISNLRLFNKILPLGGGGYFRLAPYRLFRRGVQMILKKDEAYVFYMHPWEIDPEQPKVNQASFNYRFRHYNNLNRTHARLKYLLADFGICQFVTCSEYLAELV